MLPDPKQPQPPPSPQPPPPSASGPRKPIPVVRPIPAPSAAGTPASNSPPTSGIRPIPLPGQARPVPVQGSAGSTPPRPIPVGPGSARSPAAPGQPEADEQPGDRLRAYLRAAPPWLTSALVQMLLIIVLGLWLLPPPRDDVVELEVHYADHLGEELADDLLNFEADTPTEEEILTPDDLKEVENPFAAPPTVEVPFEASALSHEIVAPQIGLALSGREEGMKKALMEAYGGTAQSEAAVQLGLQWLARQQLKDGSWSLQGPYRDGAPRENATAATAMALLAFQGNGHTHRRGTYKAEVDKGVKFLLKMQEADGSFFRGLGGHDRLYTQGQCTMVLCELYGMTRDESLREPAQRAVNYCVKSQDKAGGWRYIPNEDSDTSVTSWIVMGLQSGRMAGLEVPQTTLANIGRYLDKAARDGGALYSYLIGQEAKPGNTAQGLLCRQYLGWAQDDERLLRGADTLLEPGNLPKWSEGGRDVYYWYYATQVFHHLEGERWTTWNDVMRDLLVEKQVKSGQERGSWDPIRPVPDVWGVHGGRLYTTCLSIYILEVYYRHLPIYSSIRLRPE